MKVRKSKKEIEEILKILEEIYPDAACELNYHNSFQLLIATILSAQTTDKKVNQVTKGLFEKYKAPKDFLRLEQIELENIIKEIGLYRSKAKNIINTCRLLVEKYKGEVPDSRTELMKLPGVGRKTANVVLSNAFNVPAIAVDTHVFRVSNRIGLADSDNVGDTEKQLMKSIAENKWSEAHHLLIFHGRRICKARKPLCEKCPLMEECVYYQKIVGK
ncbi:endonuclease III [Crassaminicella profunda]|uniref:endonuclease III n=1 Tax=Crassaminicella profunda TaxID=1286698 RepID=UPI001CA7252C|nr:endonuclease III [Crassaminicella profunda]QZY53575.1 endonuclease III [Crassaminicella profunda]